jgi:hypothetical protein
MRARCSAPQCLTAALPLLNLTKLLHPASLVHGCKACRCHMCRRTPRCPSSGGATTRVWSMRWSGAQAACQRAETVNPASRCDAASQATLGPTAGCSGSGGATEAACHCSSFTSQQSTEQLPVLMHWHNPGGREPHDRIVKEDGAAGLFTGAGPTVVRAMALNMGMLASNDQVGPSACSAAVEHVPTSMLQS